MAGDSGVFVSLGSGNWKCVSYQSSEPQGADIASAGTINLDASTGKALNISGTATVTAVTLTNGRERWTRATGAYTLTQGASLVVLPGLATRTVAVGDMVKYVALNSVVYATIFTANNGPVFIATGSLNTSGDTSITVSTNIYKNLILQVNDWRAAADFLAWMRLNADTGNNYTTKGVISGNGGVGDVTLDLQGGFSLTRTNTALNDDSGTTPNPLNLRIYFPNPNLTDGHDMTMLPHFFRQAGGVQNCFNIVGRYIGSGVLSSIQLLGRATLASTPSGSNVNASSGTWTLYGEL